MVEENEGPRPAESGGGVMARRKNDPDSDVREQEPDTEIPEVAPLVEGAPVSAAALHNTRYGPAPDMNVETIAPDLEGPPPSDD